MRVRLSLMLGLVLILSGCAHVVSKDLRARTDPTVTFGQVIQNPQAYIGKYVVWGGEVIQTINQKDGTTLIEVFQRPIGWGDEPQRTSLSQGRFLVLADKYLDPYVYTKGRLITAAGPIEGEQTRPIGEMEYRYPVVRGDEIHTWRETYYAPYYGPYYYGPYYYGPYYPYYYDPWWEPSLLFRFRYHHH